MVHLKDVWLAEEAPVIAPPSASLQALLLDFAKAALKQQPADLTEFGLEFFSALKEAQQQVNGGGAPLRIIISGAPASGKGTQAARIVEQLGLVHISVGDLLRAEVAGGSQLGMQAAEFMTRGALVPDELAAQLVSQRLAREDAQQAGWLLDGFPRTGAQCTALAAAGIRPDAFLCIEVPDEVLVERVAGRRLDPQTGAIYHLTFKPPSSDILDRLIQRPDDSAETVRTRLVHYNKHVEAVKGAFADKTVAVDGNRPDLMDEPCKH